METHAIYNVFTSHRLIAGLFVLLAGCAFAQSPNDGSLRMEVITAYNFVVDSNVESPSTNGPSAAHLGVKIYNDGPTALTNVYVNIGKLTDPLTSAGTPGTFESRVNPQGYTGTFALQMPGGAADAVRYIPRIEPGQYVAQYFFVTYPLKDNLGHSVAGAAPVTTDDLWLNYDIWASCSDGASTRRVGETTKVTMRNEISAMANKIWPNTDGKVPDAYLNAIQASLGWRPDTSNALVSGAVVMQGIWYDLGNVGAGFDNNGDGLPDRNAWLQPAGNPATFSPLAARLVKCYGIVVVKLNDGTEQLIPFEDRLYFENIPGNNNGAVGLVFYEFIPLDSSKPSQLSPYQEVASGYDNEKFNGDYGASVGSVGGTPPNVAFDKTGPVNIAGGSNATYTLSATNNETTQNFGWPELGLPLVFQDSIPASLVYVAGSATSSNTPPAGQTYSVSWSTDNGATWVITEPAAASVTTIRWALSGTLAPGQTTAVSFRATVPTNYSGATINNTGYLKKGPNTDFANDTVTTLVSGTNSLGDFVWRDLDRDGVQDGAETGIANIGVTLYYDANGNGVLDTSDPLYGTTQTNASGIYGFPNLPDGRFLVVVDQNDADLPAGYSLPNSTTTLKSVSLDPTSISSSAVSVLTADWPFIPALEVVKSVTPTTYGAGDLVTYTIDMENNAAPVAPKTNPVQTAYVTTVASAANRTADQIPANAQGAPNNTFARVDYAQNSDYLASSGALTFGSATGNITKVELVFDAYLTQPMTDDTLKVSVNGLTTAAGLKTLVKSDLDTLLGNSPKTFAVDFTAVNTTWTWPLVQALTGRLEAAKDQGNDGSTLWVDSIGFRVTTDASAPSAGDYGPASIAPLPLTDTFDNTKLAYVSASVAPTSVSGGTITWANLGPLNPGVRKTITVTFRALTPPDTNSNSEPDSTTTINTATATNAYFVSGRRTNDDSGAATITINPRGSIGDRVWWDLNANGTQDSGEPGLANVLVTLSNGAQTRTDANGNYLFTGLVNGTYDVTISTATLPWTTFTQTKDPDATVNNASTVTINTTDGLSTNDSFVDRDFGYDSALNVISGSIFQDNDGDGIQDPGENFLAGVTVTLSSGATTITDANGFYSFGSLANGTYTVTVTQPGSTTQTLDPDGAVKNNVTTVVASGGNLYPNRNFAYQPTGTLTLGDTLYYDWNGNGAQDSGEQGIPNVDVFLYEDTNGNGVIDAATDSLIATSVTNALTGVYGFSSLLAGNYLVVVNTADPQFPAGVTQTQDYDTVRDGMAKVNLTASLTTVDFGYQPVGTGVIGNLVWLDADNDGIKDASESGINGVTVQLYRSGQTPGVSTPYATTTTSGGGLYSFANLPADSYTVYIPASNFTTGNALAGTPLSSTTTVTTDNAVDNDDNGSQSASGSAVSSPVIVLSSGVTDNTKDFGFVGVGSVGDFVFYDANANGQQDTSETGIANVTVKIFLDANADGVADSPTPVATTVTADGSGTNPAGFYRFDNLTPGTYIVKVDTTSPALAGLPQTTDPDFDGVPANPSTNPGDNADSLVIVTSGSAYSGADFGYQPPGAIGDFVWLDLDQDGVQDAGEPGIAGVTIQITNGTTTYTVTTDFDGYWSKVLPNGNWTVNIPASNFTSGNALENLAATYDANGIGTLNTVSLTITAGVVNLPVGNLGIDFGYKLNGNYGLSGTIAIHDTGLPGTADDVDDFFDDGVDLDAGPNDETELSGVEVFLYTSGGDFLGSTFTDSNGNYAFTGLASGSYRVIIGTTAAPLDQSVLTTTTANNLSGSTVNSTATSVTQLLTIGSSSVANVDFTFNSTVNYDFGDLPSSYGMTTLAQDGARHIIPGGGSTLYLGTAPDADTNGLPTALANGDDMFGSDDENGVTMISPAAWTNGTVGTGNGGDIQVSVTGTGWLVGWVDWNHDGDFLDSGEFIVSQAVSTGTTTISFDIPAGTIGATSEGWLSRFRVFTTEPDFPLFSYEGVATNGEVEDYLFEKPVGGSIGDLFWADTDGDGVIDSGENGIGGRIVELRNSLNVLVATQTTGTGTNDVDGDGIIDPLGYYRFLGLGADTYTVTVTNPPAGFDPSYDENGIGTANVTSVTLATAAQHLTADFGYKPQLANISGQVRYDTDSDGNPADPDSGAMVVKIQLWTDPNGDGNPADGVQYAETYTDVSGNYLFTNVPTGCYVVVEINPTGTTSTYDVAGANDDRIPVTIVGTNITGRDFLDTMPPVYAISGTVYDDSDTSNDNVIGAGDTPLASITVKLFLDRDGNGVVNAGDSQLASVVTDASGNYSFTGLPAGNYVVQETDPAGAVSDWDAAGSLTDNQIGVTLVSANVIARNFLDDGYLGNITGSVLADTNNDNTGDAPLGGVTLELRDATTNALIASTTTNGSGAYTFSNVPPGSYVVVQTQPSGYFTVSDGDATTPGDDAANASITDNRIPVSVIAGESDTGNNFLEDQPGSISGTVLNDTDGDNDGDLPMSGVVIRLLNSAGNPVLDGLGQPVTATTATNGNYSFSGLAPGNYCVSEDQPANFNSVSDSDGPNDNVIGNVTPISVVAGNNNGGNNFIEIELGVISGYVRTDDDNNGTGDTGLGGVVLNLLDGSGNPVLDGFGAPIQVATNTSGFYQFTLVPAGSYRVSQNQPAGYASVSDVDGANNNVIGDQTTIVMTPGLVVTNRDFVEIAYGAISGSVLRDVDDNGSGDGPLAGVTLTLLTGSGNPVDGDPNTPGIQPVTTSTNSLGGYRFENLLPGTYQVSETQPSGYGSVSDADGGNPDRIGNITPITVNPGQEVGLRDFIEIELGTISGYVFAGSTPLAGVTLTLLNASGQPVDGDPNTPDVQPITTVTSSLGYYSFTGVRPGTYQVGQTQPLGYDSFGDVDGGDINIIGDLSPITLLPGQHSQNNNFIETLDTCPDDWEQWKYQHPGEQAAGNPDVDAYDNFAEFAFAMPYDSGAGSPWLGNTAWIIRPSTLAPGTLEGVFIRPKGAPLNVTYTLQYAASPGNPTVWQTLVITPLMISTADNGDCTETVTIHDLETLTGLTGGKGSVRIKAELDEVPPTGTDHTSYAEVEGWKETPLEVCCRTYNNPYLRETAFTGTVSGISGQVLTFAASSGDLSTLLAGASFYLEVTSGDHEGHRFDIASASGNTVTLANDAVLDSSFAPFNTLAGAPPLTMAGNTVAIRRHWTVNEVFPPSGFVATGSQTTADQIQVFSGGAWTIYWLYDENDSNPATARWVDAADAGMANQGAAIIPPGQGLFFNKRNSATSILAYGEIRPNDFVRPLAAGSNFVGGGHPLDQSASGTAGRAMNLGAGFFGSRDFKTADSFFVWNADTTIGAGGYNTYFFLNGAPVQPSLVRWVKTGDATLQVRDSALLLLGNRSVFVRAKNALPGYTVPCPWNP